MWLETVVWYHNYYMNGYIFCENMAQITIMYGSFTHVSTRGHNIRKGVVGGWRRLDIYTRAIVGGW